MTSLAQKDAFLQGGEADAWFARNKEQLAAPSSVRTEVARLIAAHVPRQQGGSDVLEIGCGQGSNLAELATHAQARGYGLEPSSMAVGLGRKHHPDIAFQCGTADALPWPDEKFDLVWFGFCLYLVDRALLMRCVAEADRVLKPGGTLAILDFDPPQPSRRAYHHRPGLWSYKMDYPALFLANPAYCLVGKTSLSHAGAGWVEDPQERLGLTLLRKDSQHAYANFEG